ATQTESVIHGQRAFAVPRQESEEALPARRAWALARLHHEILAIGLDAAAPGQPARVRSAHAQFGAIPQQALTSHAEARQVGGKFELRCAGNLRLIEDAGVDRLAP